jgi:hypothetical protein
MPGYCDLMPSRQRRLFGNYIATMLVRIRAGNNVLRIYRVPRALFMLRNCYFFFIENVG